MDLRLTPEEDQLLGAVTSLLERHSTPERVRRAEATGFDAGLWASLQSLGVPSMALQDLDTAPASLFQLVLVAEAAGACLASAPVLEGIVAARLLARCGPAANKLLDSMRTAAFTATVSLQTAPARTPRLVPAGAVARLVVGLDGDNLVAVEAEPPASRVENLGDLSLAYRDLASGTRTIVSSGAEAVELFGAACSDWKTLGAAQLVGVGASALGLGVEYVKSRQVFGAPIATFQTIAHQLADDATAIDGARLLAYKAAWARDENRADAEKLASMAWCFASESALNVTRNSLHYHGGYGFTQEYDIQLYFRRAKAYSLVWGDLRREYHRLADLVLSKEDSRI